MQGQQVYLAAACFDCGSSLNRAAPPSCVRPSCVQDWGFSGLHSFIRKHADPALKQTLLTETIPGMARLALRMEELFTEPIPLLRKRTTSHHYFTREQVSKPHQSTHHCHLYTTAALPCRA